MRLDEIGPASSASFGTIVTPTPRASARSASSAVEPPRRRPKAKSGPEARWRAPMPSISTASMKRVASIAAKSASKGS